MTAETLLTRLECVRESRSEKLGRSWQALCPAHEDKNPSLSVRELPDQTVLLHCFSGCSAEQVLSAVGLSLADLFPRPPNSSGRRRIRKQTVLLESLRGLTAALDHEAGVLLAAATDFKRGRPADAARIARSWFRISRIRDQLRGR